MTKNDSIQKSLKESIRDTIKQETTRNMFTDLYVVTNVNTYIESQEDDNLKELTCEIKQMNGIQKFTNVQWVSQGLGNGKGLIIPPRKDDVVLVIFYGQTNTPLIIGSVFNTFMQGNRLERDEGTGELVIKDTGRNDDILDVGKEEWILINKLNGSYIFTNSDGEILIKNTSTEEYDIEGDLYTQSFMLFKKDGNIEVQCKGGKGNITL